MEASRPRLNHWANLISSGRADAFSETAILPDFISAIFLVGRQLSAPGYKGVDALRPMLWKKALKVVSPCPTRFVEKAHGKKAIPRCSSRT